MLHSAKRYGILGFMAIDRNAVIKEAQKLASKGQFDKAIAEWRKIVKEDPNDSNALNTIGDLCLKKNAKAEAVDAYKRAADILAEDGFASKAIALYKKVLNIDPSKVEVHLALGDMNAEKGLIGNALESYKIAADYYKNQNNKAKSLGIYQKMADLNPANVAFRVKLADMYATEKMLPEAVKAYLDAADVHVEKDEFQEARQMFEKVLGLDPRNTAVYHKAGIVYYKEGKIDEARKSLKRAVEVAPADDEVTNLYFEVLEKAGRSGDAEDLYRKQLAADPSRVDLHTKLYDIAVGKKEYDKALAEAVSLAQHKAESGDFAAASEPLKKLLTVTNDPPAVASALAGLFEKHGKAQEGAREITLAADVLIERGSLDEAREVLNRALALSPGFEQALEKLVAIGGPSAGAASEQPAGLAEPEAVEELGPPLEEPAPHPGPVPSPSAGAASEQPAGLAEPEAVEELGPPLEEFAPHPGAVPARSVEEAEDPAVANALAEADVLMKYGMGAKAIDQLVAVVRKYPDHIKVRSRLLDLYCDQKKTDEAVLQALMLAELYDQKGRHNESRDVLRAALELAPGNTQIMARLGMTSAAEEAVEEPASLETIGEEPVSLETIGEEPVEEIPELAVPTLDLDVPLAEEGMGVQEASEVGEPGTAAGEETAGEEFAVEEVAEFEAPDAEEPPETAAGPREQEAILAEAEREPLEDKDLKEVWAEAEFYFQQGLFDEAKKHYERFLERKPGDTKAMERIVEISREKDEFAEFSRLAETVQGLEGLIGTTDTGERVTESDVDSVTSLMKQITSLRKGKERAEPGPTRATEKPKAPPAAKPPLPVEEEISFAGVTEELSRPEPEEDISFSAITEDVSEKRPSPPQPEEEASFADVAEELSGDGEELPVAAAGEGGSASEFFDLAAELKDELSTVAPKTPVDPHEQSLDEIFDEFKKGVEEHEKKEDDSTHYNLGVAYREMGLLDDAISEFNMTSEGEPMFIQSRYMLGLCYLEKGDFETAILEIQNALGYSYSFGEASEERTSMHYDLGLAYQGMGNGKAALEEFQKVNDLDPLYREVATKIQELQGGDFISLDSIKEDIEKEISFKFLEEGTRIDREEKTKKSKK